MDPFTIMAILGGLGAGASALGGAGRSKGGLKGSLMGTPESFEQMQRFTPQQQAASGQMLSQGMGMINPQAMQDQAMSRFLSQTVPSLAERFTSLGEGGLSSSGAMGMLGKAGAGMNTDIMALLSQLGMQQAQMGMQPQFENMYRPSQPGMLEGLGNALMGAMPFAGMGAFGGGGMFGGGGQKPQPQTPRPGVPGVGQPGIGGTNFTIAGR